MVQAAQPEILPAQRGSAARQRLVAPVAASLKPELWGRHM